ncbi:MAG: DUF7220 family protein, partial [Gammaproteobacteria bacterium]
MKDNNENNGGLQQATQDRFDNFASPAMQSRRESWREAWQNTALAFAISILAHRYIVMPVLDLWADAGYDRAAWAAAFGVTLFYTALSLGRNYLIRRLHARQTHTRHLRQKARGG